MASSLRWLVHDEDQRRRVLAVIQLFKDRGTVDELGFGAIRDTLSGALFPGVSVLHTRARYLLFVPWCIQDVTGRRPRVADVRQALRGREVQLIHALLAGGEASGVIGQQAREKLKRMPSEAYWSVLRQWGIRRSDTTIDGLLRDALVSGQLAVRRTSGDEAEVGTAFFGLDPNIPGPSEDYRRSATFTLTEAEGAYLADRIRMTTGGSLLPWLLDNGVGAPTGDIWDHPRIEQAPEPMRTLVHHGRRFSLLAHGAALLYNLMLAERVDGTDGIAEFRDRLDAWHDEVAQTHFLDEWNGDALWAALRQHQGRVGQPTQSFVEGWVRRVLANEVTDDQQARSLVETRESSLKGNRARLTNAAAREQWSGASALRRLDFNWSVAARLLGDIRRNSGAV